jgi:predicted PurR-regulated permease PerM
VLLVWSSLAELQQTLPEYEPRVSSLRASVADWLQQLPFDSSRLLSVETLQPGAIVSRVLGVIGGITSTAGNLGVLVLIMAFMMLEATRYPQKLHDALDRSPVSAGRLDAFVDSMRSYVVINTIFGLIAGTLNTVLLFALGVDFAILWGVLSFLLSFLPNIGFILALVPPTLLALLQFGVARALMVLGGFIVINTVLDNVVKPRFFGESLDISPAVVVVSLVFWGWLLGPVGAILAVPLSIAVRFLFEAFDEVRWLAHLMSDSEAGAQEGSGSGEPV